MDSLQICCCLLTLLQRAGRLVVGARASRDLGPSTVHSAQCQLSHQRVPATILGSWYQPGPENRAVGRICDIWKKEAWSPFANTHCTWWRIDDTPGLLYKKACTKGKPPIVELDSVHNKSNTKGGKGDSWIWYDLQRLLWMDGTGTAQWTHLQPQWAVNGHSQIQPPGKYILLYAIYRIGSTHEDAGERILRIAVSIV